MLDVGGDTSEGQQRDCCVQLEKKDADQDEPPPESRASPLRDCGTSCEDAGDAQGFKEDGGRILDSTGDATTAWSSLELEMNFGSAAKG